MPSPASSTVHSEGADSYVLLSGAHSSYSATSHERRATGPSRRRGRASERSMRRSVEFTEVPQTELEEKDLCDDAHKRVDGKACSNTPPCPPCHEVKGDAHRCTTSTSLRCCSRVEVAEGAPYTDITYEAERSIGLSRATCSASPILPPRPGARAGEEAALSSRSTASSPAPAAPVVIVVSGDSSTPSSSFMAKSSLSTTQRGGGASTGGDSSVVQPPPSAPLFVSDSLAVLSAEQMEAALQLYVERGGVDADEVTAALQALPWYTTAAPRALPASVDARVTIEDVGEEAEQQLLDPESWLRTVAAATASAVAAAGSDVPAGAVASPSATRVASTGVAHKTQRRDSTAREAPTTVSRLSDLSDPSAPAPVERTVEKRCCSVELASEAVDAAEGTFAGRGRRPSAGIDAEMGGRSRSRDADSDGVTLPEKGADCRHVFTDRKLAYNDADNSEPRVARVERPVSLPRLAPRPRSGYAQHRPQPQPHQLAPSLTSDGQGHQGSSYRSSTSPMRSSLGDRGPSHTTSPASSQTYSPASAAVEMAETAVDPGASTFASASTTTAGMRNLFHYCLQAPLATASSTLRVSDWHALLEQLGQDGHQKMPPQPILDDVARTIAHTMHSEGHPGGLTLSDFTRVVQRQLQEIRADMIAPASSDAADGDGTALWEEGTLRFPTHPKYVLTVPVPASAASVQSTSFPSRRGIRRSSPRTLTPVLGSSHWRVLPTWCIALAGLCPMEMSRVCPVPVVRYLRSVGLIRAVLEAIMQRLQLELDATPEYLAPMVSDAGKATQSPSGSLAVDSFAWQPQREGSGRSRSGSSALPLSGASAVAGPSSSAVVTGSDVGASGDGDWPWKERPVWCSAASDNRFRREKQSRCRAASNTAAAPEEGGGDGDSAAIASAPFHRITTGSRRSDAGIAGPASGDAAKSHYLDQRPLDEISASVVARAKARRVMDTLRRHTVPINRYECFARVESEVEPARGPMCFVSKEGLKGVLRGDGNTDSDEDSDAMPDMIAALTYDPRGEMVMGVGGAATKGGGVGMDRARSSRHPPPRPRMPSSNVLPIVIVGATRATMPMRRRAPKVCAGRALSPPQPVPCMFRMSGLLSTALPRRQEEELVHRLSKPVCDPAAMSLRAVSAGHADARGHAVDTTGAVATSGPGLTNAKAMEGHPTLSASRPPSGSTVEHHHWRHSYLMRHKSAGDTASLAGQSPSRNDRHRQRSRPSSAWTDPYYASVCASQRDQPPSPLVSRTSSGVAGASKLTEMQSRGFFFDVPSVLVAAPLSSTAAAAAAAQVITSGGAPCTSLSARVVLPQPSATQRLKGRRTAPNGAPRGATRSRSAAPLRAMAKGGCAGGRRARSTSNNAAAKPAQHRSCSRSPPPCPRDAPQHGRAAAHPYGLDNDSSPTAGDTAAAVHPRASLPHSQPHMSLYERRLHRQLQLAYTDDHISCRTK
ncbi:hypothetical protein LSCM1_04697 [Leishmania martiniquensis]|uniref:Uncharacterized protein n=1 Tax=Leishmania martiniquensis TaxID=1580590 RepID=A0A836KKX7_9TRYP|nr:hypothetical protein LSCM1_04697 [Leishmania martiniquensis]